MKERLGNLIEGLMDSLREWLLRTGICVEVDDD